MQSVKELLEILPQVGRLEWIGIRTERMGLVQSVASAMVIAGRGLDGDHKSQGRAGTRRQVTLIQAEHLVAVAGMLHRERIPPELLRRNLVISGLNLLALKNKRFQIGDAVLEFSGPCEPCSRMEANLGSGGLNAMRGHGGITARVLTGGRIHVGDSVRSLALISTDTDPQN